MDFTKRELEMIFNALNRLHDSVIDGFYRYHKTDEISELSEKVYQEMKKD